MDSNVRTALNQRVWYVEGGVHPTRAPVYLALGKFDGDPSQSLGESTRIPVPDPNNFDRDISAGEIKGTRERATFGVAARYTSQRDIIMGWKNRGCRVDIYALSGKCGNPQDFTEGGEKYVFFPGGELSTHSLQNFGAYGQDENNPTNSMVDMTSREYYELLYMAQSQVASAETVRRVYTVDVFAGDNCEDCPDPCSRVFLTMAGASATPGTKPSLIYSEDGGSTWDTQDIDVLFSNEDIVDAAFIGGLFVAISNIGNRLVYTDADDVYVGQNEWGQSDVGFVASKNPNAMWSADVRHTWIVGNGGYVFFTKNPRTGVIVQNAGVATSQHLQSVHAHDTDNVLAVGNSNAVIYTTDGGVTWQSVTGPSVGVNLGACWMWDAETWFVGEGAGGAGKLWLTTNQGYTWTEVGMPDNYERIYKIMFVNEAQGYISAATGGQSVVLRTITAGNEWVVLPQNKVGLPLDNSFLTDLAVCDAYSNVAFAAGLADNGTAGIAFKFAA